MSAPVIERVRDGVAFAVAASASFVRAEREWGRIAVNSSYRDYDLQLRMWRAWNAYVSGAGPYPGHSRALHPDESRHCRGLALDTPDWGRPRFIEVMARHGWVRTAAWDPSEQHHFEYQDWNDRNRHQTAGVLHMVSEEDDMGIIIYREDNRKLYLLGEGGITHLVNGTAVNLLNYLGVRGNSSRNTLGKNHFRQVVEAYGFDYPKVAALAPGQRLLAGPSGEVVNAGQATWPPVWT